MRIRCKFFDKTVYPEGLQKIGGKRSDWIDLRASEDVVMKKGDFALIPLGVVIKLPKGYEALLLPRSSTFKTWGILQVNSMGVFDETYCGDNDVWLFPALAMRDTVIHKGDRICQFRIMEHQPNFDFVEVETMNCEDRGGIGSTGTK